MGKKQHRNIQEEGSNVENKKIKLFSAKEFRTNLTTNNAVTALKQFLEVIRHSERHDYILDYLEKGGNCLELLQTLELDSTIPPAVVFEIITYILLTISASFPQYQNSAYESCRYLLNNYITVINKMINLSSSTPERKACLKLLTAMVTFSPVLAKDILIHVNIHSANVELLSKHTGEKDSVRDNFIRFLTAYLVDGHFPALSVLLEKKGIITSIISGLKYDSSDTLCMVISAMKNFILENPSVSKTAKMKTFNTIVVRDIVSLYNWKGPAGFRAEKKNKQGPLIIDEIEKSKVNEVLHDFLLILCTNHKYGIIFKDHLVGLGKRNQNALMYTVLESLDRPWEHSYASELVIKICGSCPDLAKTQWSNLKSSLEPRLSDKWVNAMKFAVNLIKELQPSCITFCIKDLNEIQLFQIVQCLVLPLPILKTIIPEKDDIDSPSVKQYILSLLLEMLKTVQHYINVSRSHLSPDKESKLKLLINKHVSKYFPDAIKILANWNKLDENSSLSSLQNLSNIVDILNYYKVISPDLLDTLSDNDTQLSSILFNEETDHLDQSLANLQVKIVNLFIDLDASKFNTQSKMFAEVVPLLFKIYYSNTEKDTFTVLYQIFKNTGIFDGCEYEINIWINGFLDVKTFDENLTYNIVNLCQITNENILRFLDQLSIVQSDFSREHHYQNILKKLMEQIELSKELQKYPIKHRYLSPMICGLIELSKNEHSKTLMVYTNFVVTNLLHLQTKMESINHFIDKLDILPSSLKEYANSWTECSEILSLKKSKGRFHVFQECSDQFFSGDIENSFQNSDLVAYYDLQLNLLDMVLFYLINLLKNNVLTEDIATRCEKFVKNVIDNNVSNVEIIERILCNPILVYNTVFVDTKKQKSANYSTKFLTNVTKYLLDLKCDIDVYLNIYREKLLISVLKVLKKPDKYEQLSVDLKQLLSIYRLGYSECLTILTNLSLEHAKYAKNRSIVDILIYSLNEFSFLCSKNASLEPLQEQVIMGLTNYLVTLVRNQDNVVHSLTPIFLQYFKIFPHSVKFIDRQLFKSIIELSELNKDTVKLASFLMETNLKYVKFVKENLESICEKKGLLLPLLTILCRNQVDEELLKNIFDLTLTSLNKTIMKPQKVGQHYHENYEGLVTLINVAMPLKNCKTLLDKVQKFDSSEIFHVHLLKAIYLKSMCDSISGKEINNIIMTLVHLQVNLFKKILKSDAELLSKAKEIVMQFTEVLKELKNKISDADLNSLAKNETLKLYFKFCLKYGITQPAFLEPLTYLIEILRNFLEVEDSTLILEMMTSHSEFFDVMLGEHTATKTEILSLYLVLWKTWPQLMERNYVPLLLASYRASVNKCDRIILLLLKMFEMKPEQTHFYDFKPFLWGKAAATHYSVRLQLENALWRQPKMSDILDILQEHLVTSTITNYPLKDKLRAEESNLLDVDDNKSYDLVFLLPMFSQLLAPEEQVQTYKFTRSGALSLTVIGLSSSDKEIRQAACHVLARFHFHVDARQTGKDNLLWIRYIEAVCKGTALLPDFKLNNFAAIYLARMALILTQPNHVMYRPLSQHLTAKSALDFSTVPELYTFLHSPDVNFKEHRNFTLELLRDGLRNEKDFSDFMRSMAFKLFSELYSSRLSDFDTKLLILDVIKSLTDIPLGIKFLCENSSFLAHVYTDIHNMVKYCSKEKSNSFLLEKNLEIFLKIVQVVQDRHSNFMIFEMIKSVINYLYSSLTESGEKIVFEIVFLIFSRFLEFFSDEFLNMLLVKVDDSVCKYWHKYGCDYVCTEDLNINDKYYYLRMFVRKFKK